MINQDYFKDKKVLVTGGSGSIGSAIVKSLLRSVALACSYRFSSYFMNICVQALLHVSETRQGSHEGLLQGLGERGLSTASILVLYSPLRS